MPQFPPPSPAARPGKPGTGDQPSSQAALADGNVVAFRPRPSNALTYRDQLELDRWRAHLRSCGFSRVEIHTREDIDPPDVENFAALYRAGQAWSEYGFARLGGQVLVWSSAGGDFGRFPTVSDAMVALLPVAMRPRSRKGRR